MSASSYTHLDFVEIVAESNKERGALLVRYKRKGTINEQWIPYSVIADADDYRKGDVRGTISILSWWADKENVHN